MSVAALSASEKVPVTVVPVATPVAPAAGTVAMTVGGVVSALAVVNDQLTSAASGLPATSVMPPTPPLSVAT